MPRQIALEKTQEVEEVRTLLQQYRALGVASLEKVRTAQLQGLKRKLENNAYFRVIKNALIRRAVAQCKDKPELKKLEEHLSGANIFLFTNINPFKLVLLLEKSRVKATARAGDIAAEDVIISAGNTGLSPGPKLYWPGTYSLSPWLRLRTAFRYSSVWKRSNSSIVAGLGGISCDCWPSKAP